MTPVVTRSLDVLVRFARLGLTSFGGPVAHLGYFRREFVQRARWLDDTVFAEIVALCSVLPGPSSTQVCISLGLMRAGPAGALLAWVGFALPSALLLGGFGLALRAARESGGTFDVPPVGGALDALAGAAAAVVLIAIVALGRSLLKIPLTGAIAAGAFVAAMLLNRIAPALQWLPLLLGGVAGAAFAHGTALPQNAPPLHISRRNGMLAGGTFLALLGAFSIAAGAGGYIGLATTFFQAGSLVFGGGHVVLPFLQSLISEHHVAERTFYAGYGAAQAVPGPVFTFAAFLGAVDASIPYGAWGALVALLAIFAPSFLLIAAAVPLWHHLRTLPRAGGALAGLNAAVVGLLAAVFVDPIAMSLTHNRLGIGSAAIAFVLLQFLKLPPWAVVLCCAAAGVLLHDLRS